MARSTKLTQIRRGKTTQTLANKHGSFEHNWLTHRKPVQIAQHRCDVVVYQTISSIADWLQFPQYTVAYTSQKTVAVIQAAANESMYERLNCIWRQQQSHTAVESNTSGKPVQRGPTYLVSDEAKIRHFVEKRTMADERVNSMVLTLGNCSCVPIQMVCDSRPS